MRSYGGKIEPSYFDKNLNSRYNLKVLRRHLICLISVTRLYTTRLCVLFYILLNDQKCLWDTNENEENPTNYS